MHTMSGFSVMSPGLSITGLSSLTSQQEVVQAEMLLIRQLLTHITLLLCTGALSQTIN